MGSPAQPQAPQPFRFPRQMKKAERGLGTRLQQNLWDLNNKI